MKDSQLKYIKYIAIGILIGGFVLEQSTISLASMLVLPQKITIYQADVAEQEDLSVKVTDSIFMKDSFPIPYLFSIPDDSDVNFYQQKEFNSKNESAETVIISRNINIHIPFLKYASKINLNLFPNLHQIASCVRIEHRSDSDFTWFGSVNNSNGVNAIFSVKGQALCGNVIVNNKTYHIEPLSPPLHRISLPDYSVFPEEHPPVQYATSIDKDVDKNLSSNRGDDGSIIHVMVVYTEKVAIETENINAMIQLAVDETNVSYENSNIQTKLNLVHTHKVDYVEADIIKDLDRLSSQHDGFMDEVHDLRDLYCADIVVLIEDLNNYCGVSYLNADSEHAFCVVSKNCATGYYSFGHEIGHLFGARHNPESDPTVYPYPYGHGYLNGSGWRTIMAYNNELLCPEGFCRRVLYWSNPSFRFQNMYMGSFSTHNNARLLNETALKLANFRYFGKGFTINNNGVSTLKIMSVSPEKEWLTIIHQPKTPCEIAPTHSKSFNIQVDWNDIQTTEDSLIWINSLEKEISLQVTAIPINSVPVLSVTPTEINCSTDISIHIIYITGSNNSSNNNMKWRSVSNSSWLTVIDGYRGNGAGMLTLRVDKNLMGSRTGVLKITAANSKNIQQTVTIKQSGSQLSVTLPKKVKEKDMVLTGAGRILVPKVLDSSLRIQLTTSDPEKLTIPEYVEIPPKSDSIDFDIQILDDEISEGPKIVSVKAFAAGWQAGEAKINVLDNDSQGIIYVGEDQLYQTIQEAVNDASSESSIIVKDGIYKENLVIDKTVYLYSENGPEHSIITAKYSTDHVIEIQKSHTIVEGLSIVGATTYGKAGIFLSSSAKFCLIKNNICGIDDQQGNYYGIYAEGTNNTITGNISQFNQYGAFLYCANNNTLHNNIFQFNEKAGSYLYNSQNNILCMNTFRENKVYGLSFRQNSYDNQLYLNEFIKSKKEHVYSRSVVNIWHNLVPSTYQFGRQRSQGFLGNYYDDHDLSDQNEDGITDKFYSLPGNESLDEFPLSDRHDQFRLTTRYADGLQQISFDGIWRVQKQQACVSGEVLLFKSDLETELTWDMTENDAWTGNIHLEQPLDNGHSLNIQIGIIDETDTFTPIGKSLDIKSDDRNLTFHIFPGPYTIPPGHWFGFQLTHTNPQPYTVISGGGHTFISPYHHSHNNGKQWLVGPNAVFRQIQSAINFSDMGYTVTVLPGVYNENIKIIHPVTIISEKGYTQTVISSKMPDEHAIHIMADNVNIIGFRIYGSTRKKAAGICINSGASQCRIEQNRCGYDSTHANDYGILIQSSLDNIISSNYFISNEKHGIWVDNSFNNELSYNWCFRNRDSGIAITNSLNNQIKNNTVENNYSHGIYLQKSFRNFMMYNCINSNKKYGIYIDKYSVNNEIQLNNIILNQVQNVRSYGLNQWISCEPINYQYQKNIFTQYLGNYYSDNNLNDMNNDGISDSPYEIGSDRADTHALMKPFSAYEFIVNTTIDDILTQSKAPEQINLTSTDFNTVSSTKPDNQSQKKETMVNRKPSGLFNEKISDHDITPVSNKHVNTIKPILVFTDVPVWGNRLKNLKGMAINASPQNYIIAVYIKIDGTGWRSKPYIKEPIIPITDEGLWECDITTAPFDQNAREIIAFLLSTDINLPALSDAPVLPDVLFEKAAAVVRVSR